MKSMDKIQPLPGINWDAHAALHSALESIKPMDGVLILFERKGSNHPEGINGYRSANLTYAESIYLMELRKYYTFEINEANAGD